MVRDDTEAKRDGGFTLIELLVTILVVGILAGIAIPAYLIERNHAGKGATEENAHSILADIVLSRENRGASLGYVTGSWWSMGQCQPPQVILTVDDPNFATSQCGTRWLTMTNNIAYYSGDSVEAVRRVLTDGWGRPMVFDENEGEGTSATKCTNPDALFSTGGQTTFGTSSQWVYRMPLGGFC